MPTVDPIHREGQPNLRPGMFITVLEMPPQFGGSYENLYEVPQYTMCGIVLRVIAVQVPYVVTSVEFKHNDLPAGTRLTFDLRRYQMGFLNPTFVGRIRKYANRGTRTLLQQTTHRSGDGDMVGSVV